MEKQAHVSTAILSSAMALIHDRNKIGVDQHEAAIAQSAGSQAANVAIQAVKGAATDLMPYGSLLSTLFKSVKDLSNISSDPRTQIAAILRAMSVNDSQRDAGMGKLDIDDTLFAMLSDHAKQEIAKRILKHFQAGRWTSVNDIPSSLGNDEAKQYVQRVISRVS